MMGMESGNGLASEGGSAQYQAPEPGETITIYQHGQPRTLQWVSKEAVVEQLIVWEILDQNSAAFLLKASDGEAKEALTALGPQVRNPSAVLTRKLKEMAQGYGVSLQPNPKLQQ